MYTLTNLGFNLVGLPITLVVLGAESYIGGFQREQVERPAESPLLRCCNRLGLKKFDAAQVMQAKTPRNYSVELRVQFIGE